MGKDDSSELIDLDLKCDLNRFTIFCWLGLLLKDPFVVDTKGFGANFAINEFPALINHF